MTKSQKKHNSSVRVLEFLKLLTQEDVCLNNICENSEEKFKNIEAHETFLKYINTLYISGLKIKKVGKKYSLYNSFSTINFSEDEFDLLLKIYENFNNCCMDRDREELDLFYTNIFKFLQMEDKTIFLKKIANLKKDNYKNILAKKAENYQNILDLHQKIKITCNEETMVVEPKELTIENKKLFLIVYNPQNANIMKILTDNIQNLEILPVKTKNSCITETVVFEVYDRLADNYRLRACEKIQTFTENKKVIINCGEDKKQLFRRLLKYGENCKVLLPKSFRKEILNSLVNISEKLKEGE